MPPCSHAGIVDMNVVGEERILPSHLKVCIHIKLSRALILSFFIHSLERPAKVHDEPELEFSQKQIQNHHIVIILLLLQSNTMSSSRDNRSGRRSGNKQGHDEKKSATQNNKSTPSSHARRRHSSSGGGQAASDSTFEPYWSAERVQAFIDGEVCLYLLLPI
jgi:hypothetical protein